MDPDLRSRTADLIREWSAAARKGILETAGDGIRTSLPQVLEIVDGADREAHEIADRLLFFVDKATAATDATDRVLTEYEEALTLPGVAGGFLPDLSDATLRDLPRSLSSPFRGIRYAASLVEIANELRRADQRRSHRGRRSKQDQCLGRIESLRSALLKDCQVSRSVVDHQRELNPTIVAGEILQVKRALTADPPGLVPHRLLRTSSHLYLRGIRFYYSRLRKGLRKSVQLQGGMFSIHSRSSGLIVPSERYGFLVVDRASADDLSTRLPTGSLSLDLSNSDKTTDRDLASVSAFRLWSGLVRDRTLELLNSVLETWERDPDEAVRTIRSAANPIRTVYFDTGIVGAAHLAAEGRLPRVQYLTTRESVLEAKATAGGQALLSQVEQLSSDCGPGLTVFASTTEGWPRSHGLLKSWTLVLQAPSGKIERWVWTSRDDDTKRITYGAEAAAFRRASIRSRAEMKTAALASGLAVGTAADLALWAATHGTPLSLILEPALPVIAAAITGTAETLRERSHVASAIESVSDHRQFQELR